MAKRTYADNFSPSICFGMTIAMHGAVDNDCRYSSIMCLSNAFHESDIRYTTKTLVVDNDIVFGCPVRRFE